MKMRKLFQVAFFCGFFLLQGESFGMGFFDNFKFESRVGNCERGCAADDINKHGEKDSPGHDDPLIPLVFLSTFFICLLGCYIDYRLTVKPKMDDLFNEYKKFRESYRENTIPRGKNK